MGVRDIIVVLDETRRSEVRLAMAADLARTNDAHLIGLCPLDLIALPATTSFEIAGYAESIVLDVIARMRAQARERATPIETRFREQLRINNLQGEWRLADGPAADVVVRQARSADVVILGQNDPDDPPQPQAKHLVEHMLFGSGRPVLVIPYAGQFSSIGRRVLIGWNESREATRAVHDALPLIRPDAAVTLLSVTRNAAGASEDFSTVEIAAHLARHGLSVTTADLPRGDVRAEDLLLNQASEMGADLVVIGGYGHSRLREMVLGGVTRSLLKSMVAPVLMSH
ncbi:MAG: universal stress protein [Acetobacteraceae bacterium]|nr:universal stress protein [Acetobacteraceae bacterium]